MKIATKAQIQGILPTLDLIPAIEEGFVAYSEGRAVVPPVGELILDKGEVHIKSGFIKGDDLYVIKIASGFYGNSALGLPSGNGCMLLFNQNTGESAAVLLDEGLLTDVRTAVAGAVAAKYFAPRKVERIGIVGAGVQARLQLAWLRRVTDCRDVLAWGPIPDELEAYKREMESRGFKVETTPNTPAILTDLQPGRYGHALEDTAPFSRRPSARYPYHRRWFGHAGQTRARFGDPGPGRRRRGRQPPSMPPSGRDPQGPRSG